MSLKDIIREQAQPIKGHFAPIHYSLLLWALFYVVVTVIGFIQPTRPIWHVYWQGVMHWWGSEPLYGEGPHGFLYLPASILFMTPFYILPEWLAVHVWRLVHFIIFTTALIRLVKLYCGDLWQKALGMMFLLIIPTVGINLLRTQVELPMFGLVLHAAIDIAQKNWRRGGAILGIAFVLKPLALVPALLFGVAFPRICPSFIIITFALIGLSFIHPDPHYVWEQYQAFPSKLSVASSLVEGKWFDFAHMLSKAGFTIDPTNMTIIRLVAAASAFVVTLYISRIYPPRQTALAIMTIAVCFLMLFNPRVEEGSYKGPAVLASLQVIWAYQEGRREKFFFYLAMILGLSTNLLGSWVYQLTSLWMKPLICTIMAAPLVKDYLRGPGKRLSNEPIVLLRPSEVVYQGSE